MRIFPSPGDGPYLLSAPVSLAFDRPPRDAILGPLVTKGSVVHLRGPQSAANTAIAFAIADAVARGRRALMWSAPRPRRVLFLAADVPPSLFDRRGKALAPNLEIRAAPAEFALTLAGVDLLILDAPTRSAPAGAWRRLARAIESWRERGIAVLLVGRDAAHALDGMIDRTIGVAEIADRRDQGACFRHVLVETGAHSSEAFAEASLGSASGRGRWRVYTREHAELMRISGLARADFGVEEIAHNLGASESRVRQLLAPADRHASAWIAPHRRQSAAQSSQRRPAIRANSDTLAVTNVAPRRLAWPAISTS